MTGEDYHFESIEEIEEKNREIGHFFFTEDTKEFFNSRIETEVIDGKYFITSERHERQDQRRYTIRKAEEDGSISTISSKGEVEPVHAYQDFETLEEARESLEELLEED